MSSFFIPCCYEFPRECAVIVPLPGRNEHCSPIATSSDVYILNKLFEKTGRIYCFLWEFSFFFERCLHQYIPNTTDNNPLKIPNTDSKFRWIARWDQWLSESPERICNWLILNRWFTQFDQCGNEPSLWQSSDNNDALLERLRNHRPPSKFLVRFGWMPV